MAKKFKSFETRDKPRKRGARHHKKSQNKSEKRQKKQTRYKGQGWQTSYKILYYPCSLNYPFMELFKLHFV